MATLMNDIFELNFYLPKVVSPRYPLKYRHNQVSYIFSTLKVLKKHQHSEILPYLPSQVPQPTSQPGTCLTQSHPIPSTLSVQNRPQIFLFLTASLYYMMVMVIDQIKINSGCIFKGLHMERFDNKRNSQP